MFNSSSLSFMFLFPFFYYFEEDSVMKRIISSLAVAYRYMNNSMYDRDNSLKSNLFVAGRV